MKIFRKIAAIITVAAIAVAAAASTVVTAGADSIFDTAKEIKSGVATSTIIDDWGAGYNSDYKIIVSKSGTLIIELAAGWNIAQLNVFDSDGNTVVYNDYKVVSGKYEYFDTKEGIKIKWNSTTEKVKAKAYYPVNKGTYYIRAHRSGIIGAGDGKLTLTATFPGATESTAKINYLTINLKKGDTLSLGASVSGSGTVKWSSSKPTVAAVSSSGKVTAKKAGSAVITAKVGSSSQKIKIVVS